MVFTWARDRAPTTREDEVTKVAGCTTTAESSCRRWRHAAKKPPESRTRMSRSEGLEGGPGEERTETPDPRLSSTRPDDAAHQIDAPDATAQVGAAQPRSGPLGPDRARERRPSPLSLGLRKKHHRLPCCLVWPLRHLEPPPRQASDLHLHAQASSRRLFARRRAAGVCTHRAPPLADGRRHHRRRRRGAGRGSSPGGSVWLLFKQVTGELLSFLLTQLII
jgi:hypothetical protein